MNRTVTTDYLHYKLIAAAEVNTTIPTVDTSRNVFVGSFALMTGILESPRARLGLSC